MPDKKISQFDTFPGETGEDVFFIISSGEASNSNAQNYKIPFNDLKSDLGLDAGGGGAVIGGDEDNIDFGGTDPGDNREINFQQGGENVMVINQNGDVNMQNDLYVSGSISGDSAAFENVSISDDLIVSGAISGDTISSKNGIFSDLLSSPTGYFEEIIVSGDAHISGDFYVSGTTYINEVIDTTVSGAISGHTGIFNSITGQRADFSERLTISGLNVLTGTAWQYGPNAGEIYYNDGNVGIGTTNPNSILTVQGDEAIVTIKKDAATNIAYIGDSATAGDFGELVLYDGDQAGNPVKVALTASGYSYLVGGNVGIGTTDPNASLHVSGGINLQRGGGASPLLQFTDTEIGSRWIGMPNGTSSFAIYGTNGTTQELTISGGNVGIGDNSPDAKLHVKGGASNNQAIFESTDFTSTIQFKDDQGYAEFGCINHNAVIMPSGVEKMRITSAGNVGIGTVDPLFNLDVNGAANVSDVLYVGGVRISGDGNGNLVFG